MSNPNLVDLRDWRKKPPFEPRKSCFASTRETLALLRAFIAIESPLVRAEIIRAAQNAASQQPNPPPKNAGSRAAIGQARSLKRLNCSYLVCDFVDRAD